MEFLEIAKHLRTLTYYHRPDYQKLFMTLISIMQKGKFSWSDPYDWEQPFAQKSTLTLSVSPIQKSLEFAKKPKSREVGEPLKDSPDDVNGPKRNSDEKMSKEKGSKEKGSKEKMSREKGSKELSKETGSAEGPNFSAEKADDETRKEYFRLLPFDLDFFASDPIGF
uniref:Protein kinase domain-containing protein n=1 Tax=Caenorhabditis japonica TaxID=281687 RepID=A0A8R1DWA4_CAEJA